MTHILLVEDDEAIVKNLQLLLKQNDFRVTHVGTQREALSKRENTGCDLMLLDLTLPDGSGFAVCSAAKRMKSDMPVIFLTATDDEFSVVTGLDVGADDYISKPFRPMELISRIKSVLRRTGKTQSVFEIDDVRVDSVRAIVTKAGQEVNLSALEYRLLLIFLSHRGKVLSREALLNDIWDEAGDFVNDNTLTVYIKRLREKIETNPAAPSIIRTVRGIGYIVGG